MKKKIWLAVFIVLAWMSVEKVYGMEAIPNEQLDVIVQEDLTENLTPIPTQFPTPKATMQPTPCPTPKVTPKATPRPTPKVTPKPTPRPTPKVKPQPASRSTTEVMPKPTQCPTPEAASQPAPPPVPEVTPDLVTVGAAEPAEAQKQTEAEIVYTKTRIMERLSDTDQQMSLLKQEREVSKENPSSQLYGKSNYVIIAQDIDFIITTAVIYITLMILITGLYAVRNSVKKRKD